MVVVPRLFEVLRARILKQVEKQGKLANYLLRRALALGGARRRAGAPAARQADGPAARRDACARRSAQRFGGRIKAMVSGGAPLNPEVGIFFQSLGLTMLQGYGQTESGAGRSAVNRPSAGHQDGHGRPAAARISRCRIAEDGEILVRGELVMHGYWRNEAETARRVRRRLAAHRRRRPSRRDRAGS